MVELIHTLYQNVDNSIAYRSVLFSMDNQGFQLFKNIDFHQK